MEMPSITGLRAERALSRKGDRGTWLARDAAGGRVVVRAVQATGGASAGLLPVFTSRALAATALRLPQLVPVTQRGKADGALFVVRAYVEGDALRAAGPALPLDDKLRVCVVLGRALEAAHRRGFVHGGVKPENVFLRAGRRTEGAAALDEVLLTDAALTAAHADDPEARAFVAPELRGAARAGALDARMDQFSLAALCSWLVAGDAERGALPPELASSSRLADALARARSGEMRARANRIGDLVDAIEDARAALGAPAAAQEGADAVRADVSGRRLSITINGVWSLRTIVACVEEVDRALAAAGPWAVGYVVNATGGSMSTAVLALQDLHRRLRGKLSRVATCATSPEARGFGLLVGKGVEGVPWRDFTDPTAMNAWLAEGAR